MLKWFRQSGSPHQTALAMIGAKAGDRVLVAGDAPAALVAELARTTGLNGQTLVACGPGSRPAVEAAAAKAGALVDLVDLAPDDATPIPAGVTAMDIVVLIVELGSVALDARLAATRESLAALRAGGRLVLIDQARRKGVFSAQRADSMPPDAVVPMLTSVGASAARALGAEGGVTYYEARKPR